MLMRPPNAQPTPALAASTPGGTLGLHGACPLPWRPPGHHAGPHPDQPVTFICAMGLADTSWTGGVRTTLAAFQSINLFGGGVVQMVTGQLQRAPRVTT
jgi:hypothetical protein